MVAINPLYDFIPPELAMLPRVCPRTNCPSPTNVELKYFNNKSVAGFTQPRFLCNGCKEAFTLGGKQNNLKPKAKAKTNNRTLRIKHVDLANNKLVLSTKASTSDNLTSTFKNKILESSTSTKNDVTSKKENEGFDTIILEKSFASEIHNNIIQNEALKCNLKRKRSSILQIKDKKEQEKSKIMSYLIEAQLALLDIDIAAKGLDLQLSYKKIRTPGKNIMHKIDPIKTLIKGLGDVFIEHETKGKSNYINRNKIVQHSEDINVEYETIQRLLDRLDKLHYGEFSNDDRREIEKIGKSISTWPTN